VSCTGVLIVTNERDVDADYVVRILDQANVPVVRLNTERLPEWEVSLAPGRHWSLGTGGRSLSSDGCVGVWWRRPEAPPRPPDVTIAEWETVVAQWFALLYGMHSVPGPGWISAPSAIRFAENKATQLREAAALGFPVPTTSWTNDVNSARAVLDGHAGVVKSITTAHWEERSVSHFMFAHPVAAEDLPASERLSSAPLAFQQRILNKRDVRVTVIGNSAFAAVTDCVEASGPDWRLSDDPRWEIYDLPQRERELCAQLVARLGLRFAGIDLLVDKQGRHWFCELNPNGEWGWLQAAGLPIADAISAELTR
jgi:hypothetical protein